MKRKNISKKLRFEIFKRDSFTCQYCGATPPSAILHVDHITAVKNGGDNSDDNLITSCAECNQGKSAIPLSDIPKSLKEKSKIVAEKEAQIKGYNKIMLAARKRLEDDVWSIINELGIYAELKCGTRTVTKSTFSSIKGFVCKMGVSAALEAADITNNKDFYSDNSKFKYFCGVCWRIIKEGK